MGLVITDHDTWSTIIAELGLIIQVASFDIFSTSVAVFTAGLLSFCTAGEVFAGSFARDQTWSAHFENLVRGQ